MNMGLVLFGLFLFGWANQAGAQLQFGISGGDRGVDSFYVAIGDYYRVPEREVVVVRERHIPDDEIPVVFFIASRAGVSSQTVLNMRLGGSSWMDIALHFGLGPEVFYVPVEGTYGPPYGHAYGYYRHHKRGHWKDIRLGDADVVNFVNLRFMSEHYGYSPDRVIRMRSEGRNFREINNNFHSEKFEKKGMMKEEKGFKGNKEGRHEKGGGNHGKEKGRGMDRD
jgi:hypothetical protein